MELALFVYLHLLCSRKKLWFLFPVWVSRVSRNVKCPCSVNDEFLFNPCSYKWYHERHAPEVPSVSNWSTRNLSPNLHFLFLTSWVHFSSLLCRSILLWCMAIAYRSYCLIWPLGNSDVTNWELFSAVGSDGVCSWYAFCRVNSITPISASHGHNWDSAVLLPITVAWLLPGLLLSPSRMYSDSNSRKRRLVIQCIHVGLCWEESSSTTNNRNLPDSFRPL